MMLQMSTRVRNCVRFAYTIYGTNAITASPSTQFPDQLISLRAFSTAPEPASAVGSSGNGRASSKKGTLLAALICLPAAAYAGYQSRDIIPQPRQVHPSVSRLEVPAPWLAELSTKHKEVMNAESLELQAIFNSDHLFAAYAKNGLIRDLRCFYDPEGRCLHAVVQLSSGLCGYPRVLHGGFTAAFLDEAFGLLFYCLRQQGDLPFISPAFTAQLEVSFKKKVEATPGRLLLATVEVEKIEGRKLWMTASLRESPQGKVYASAKALFVAPSSKHLLKAGVKYVASGLFPGFFSLE